MSKKIILMMLALSVSFLQACSSNKIVKSYEGDVLPNEQLGLLVASENISLLSINGKDVPTYLLSNLETTYGLKPGYNKVVFIYDSVWANVGAKSADKPRSITVESVPLSVDVEVSAGEKYHFSFTKPGNLREAQELAKDIQVTLYDSADRVAALSSVYKPEEDNGAEVILGTPKAVAPTPVDSASKVKSNTATSNSSVSKTDALKAIWAQMSAKEKKEFLVWAFQE